MALTPGGVQTSTKYTLTGPDGTIATFNEPADPNFVGYLTETTGLDSPEVRESAENTAGLDGGIHGNFLYGRRPITLAGSIINVISATDRNAKITKLQQASNAMREDAVLSWTPDGGEASFINVRRAQPLRVTGGWNKDFQLLLVSADPRVYAKALTVATAALGATVGTATGSSPTGMFTVLATKSGNTSTLYVANKASNTVSVFSITGTGEYNLTLLETKATGVGPSQVRGDAKNIYVSNRGANTVSKYTRNEATGALTALGAAVATGEEPTGIAVSEKVVVVTNFKSGSLSSYVRAESGELTLKETKTEAGITDAAIDGLIAFSGTKEAPHYNLFIVSNSKNLLANYSVNVETAVLTKVETKTAGVSPTSLSFGPASKVVGVKVVYSGNVIVGGNNRLSSFSLSEGTIPIGFEISGMGKITGVFATASSSIKPMYVFAAEEGGNIWEYKTSALEPYGAGKISVGGTPSGISGFQGFVGPVYVAINSTNRVKKFKNTASYEGLLPEGTPVACENKGSMETYPVVRLTAETGTITAPTITNTKTGETLSFSSLVLGEKEVLVIDTLNRTAIIERPATEKLTRSVTNAYSVLDYAISSWWALGSGTTEVSVGTNSFTTAKIEVEFRSAWI